MLPDRRNDAENNAEKTADDHRGKSQLDGCRETLLDLYPDLLPGHDGFPEITLQEPADKQSVLNIKGFVQSEMLPYFLKRLFRSPLSQHQIGWITGGDVKHEKDDDGYPQKGGKKHQYASKNVGQHEIINPEIGKTASLYDHFDNIV
jgi:hypothetical protein